MMPHWSSRLLSLLYVSKCAACHTRLPWEEEGALCPLCQAAYENAKERCCPLCGRRLPECLCTPPVLARVGRVKQTVKLFRYHPHEADLPENRLLYTLKHHNLRPLQRFLGDELAAPLRPLIAGGDYIVTYPPRSRTAMRRYGFDHGAALARDTAAALGLPFQHLLVRGDRMGGEQKRLSRTERLSHAQQAYAVRPGKELAGRRILLIDDIVTTGATLAAAAACLRHAGAKEVICAVLAITM